MFSTRHTSTTQTISALPMSADERRQRALRRLSYRRTRRILGL